MITLKFETPTQFQNFYGTKALLTADKLEKVEVRVNKGKSSLEDMPENRFLLEKLNIPYSVS